MLFLVSGSSRWVLGAALWRKNQHQTSALAKIACAGEGWSRTWQWTIIGTMSSSAMSSVCPLRSVMGRCLSGGKPTSDTHPAALCMAIALPDWSLCSGAALALVDLVTWWRFVQPGTRTITWTFWANTSQLQLRIYSVSLSLFRVPGWQCATPHCQKSCGMYFELAIPPHAVAPIFTRYEHNQNYVGLAGVKTQ